MPKRTSAEDTEMLIASLREAVQFHRGSKRPAKRHRVYATARDVVAEAPRRYGATRIRDIRNRLGLSQTVFAATLNVSPATVRAWEQGARTPEGPSRRLLEIADRHPDILLENLS